MRPAIVITLTVLLAAPGALAEGALAVGVDQLARWRQASSDDLLIIDVRPPHRFDARHIQGAINIPAFGIGGKPLPKTIRIVLYDDGLASGECERAAAALTERGFTEVHVLEGGLTAWQAARRRVVAPPGPSPTPFVGSVGAVELEKLLAEGRATSLIDLRPAAAWRDGHLPRAVSLPDARGLESHAAKLDRSALIVVYDDGDGSAQQQAEALRRMGFRAVHYLHGGMPAWKLKGLGIEK